MQGAADPEHSNKHPGTYHPLSVYQQKFEQEKEKNSVSAAACRSQTFIKLK
jgi:hypothetical protein